MPRVLMIAFEFPPSNGASVQRILSIYHAFLSQGWQVDVLSVDPRAYPDGNTVGGVDPSTLQKNGDWLRPMAYDVQRDFAYRGKYLGCLMTPDRWGLTWIHNANRLVRKHCLTQGKPDLIWSSAPIPSVHYLAMKVRNDTGAPWVADYRDPMPYLHRKIPWYQRWTQTRIDAHVAKHASHVCFATQSMQSLYQQHWSIPSQKCSVIKNGFVQSNFIQAASLEVPASLFRSDRFSLYYAGVLYSQGRCPDAVFMAVRRWNEKNPARRVELVFQGVPDAGPYQQRVEELGMSDDVRFLPKTSYVQSLRNMQAADALLLIQDAQFKDQIPGKLYEYLNTDLPVLIKAPANSATAQEAMRFDGVRCGENEHLIYDSLCDIIQMNKVVERPLQAKRELSREMQAQQVVEISHRLLNRADTLLHTVEHQPEKC